MSRSQFPKPWKSIEGSYDDADYSPRWEFNDRDAGATAAFAGIIQPIVLSAVAWLEMKAVEDGGSMSVGEAGTAYVSIFSIAMVCKVAAGFLKSHGTSVIHDVGTWFWRRFLEPFFTWVIDAISQMLPGHHRRIRRRRRWNERVDNDRKPQRDGIWHRWRNRRNRGDR